MATTPSRSNNMTINFFHHNATIFRCPPTRQNFIAKYTTNMLRSHLHQSRDPNIQNTKTITIALNQPNLHRQPTTQLLPLNFTISALQYSLLSLAAPSQLITLNCSITTAQSQLLNRSCPISTDRSLRRTISPAPSQLLGRNCPIPTVHSPMHNLIWSQLPNPKQLNRN